MIFVLEKLTMRKNIAAGNWKMNLSFDEGQALVKGIHSSQVEDVLTILGVPFPYLLMAKSICEGNDSVAIAAQNMHHMEKGAYTGEVSPQMLTSIGIQYVILGHSERREYQNEDNQLLKQKVDLALAHDLIPIFCCGESLAIRKSGNHISYVCNQLSESLFHLGASDFAKLIIAYEPIWAIGTGETASPAQAQEMHHALRSHIAGQYSDQVAEGCSLLYGGSVKPANATELFGQPDVDGGLVGGASLKTVDFNEIRNSF
jgi:triosephosphate isomerase